jgi:hypothetical protein
MAIGTAEALFVLFLDKKNQKSSNQIGFFCRTGLCAQATFCLYPVPKACLWHKIRQNRGLGLYHCQGARSLCAMKIPLALQPHNPISFCLIFTRSLSADGGCRYHDAIQKAGKGLQENRAGCLALWAEGFFLLDLLVTFGSSQK